MTYITKMILGIACGLGVGFVLSPPAQAASPSDRTFLCKQGPDGTYQTVARTRTQGDFPVFVWRSRDFPDWPPKRRCEAVSERLQRLNYQGMTNYLMAGYLNGEPVICAARNRSVTTCSSETLIFTLRYRYDGGGQTLAQYATDRITRLQTAGNANSQPLYETRALGGQQGETVFFNFVGYLEQLEEAASTANF